MGLVGETSESWMCGAPTQGAPSRNKLFQLRQGLPESNKATRSKAPRPEGDTERLDNGWHLYS